MSTAERFEDLRIWQQARALNRTVYHGTSRLKDYAFVDQIRRASLSVMNNIAEGFERRTDADFAHFLDIAKGSAGEVRSMTYVAEDEDYLPKAEITTLRDACIELSKGIGAFTRFLRQPKTK